MAKRGVTFPGSAFLEGPRFDLTRRVPRDTSLDVVIPVITPEGFRLNEPESLIYQTLSSLRLNFKAQDQRGPARSMLGALIDFAIYDTYPPLALEYQGPFHMYERGREKDFWRTVTRQQLGYLTVWLFYGDLYTNGRPDRPKLKRRLLQIIGQPTLAAVQTQR